MAASRGRGGPVNPLCSRNVQSKKNGKGGLAVLLLAER